MLLFYGAQVITGSNVTHALSLLSDKTNNKEAHFERLLEGLDPDVHSDIPEEEAQKRRPGKSRRRIRFAEIEVRESADTGDEGDNTGQSILKGLPLTRVVLPPFVRLPSSTRRQDPGQSMHSYTPWTTGVSTDADLDEEDILPSDTDDDELCEELDDEDDLDTRDQEQQEGYERSLWRVLEPPSDDEELVGEAGMKRKRDVDDESDGHGKKSKCSKGRLNLETCEPQGRVKSAAYILDSD